MPGQHQTDGSEIREKLPPSLHPSDRNHNHSSGNKGVSEWGKKNVNSLNDRLSSLEQGYQSG